MKPADKARAIAERARTRQNAPTQEQATLTPTGQAERATGPSVRSQWYVRKADGELVDVLFHPPVTAEQARQEFYPTAIAIFSAD